MQIVFGEDKKPNNLPGPKKEEIPAVIALGLAGIVVWWMLETTKPKRAKRGR